MNTIEKTMMDVLKKLKNQYGVIGVKAEFEAEGTRMDELLRLIEIVRKLDLKLGIKIGGCEAMKDLMECKQIGTDYIIAPMVESGYALRKYIDAKNKIFSEEERADTQFLINIETKESTKNIRSIIQENNLFKKNQKIDGWVFGRVDYGMSIGYSRQHLNFEKNNLVTKKILEVAKLAKQNKMQLVVGGGVSLEAINILKSVQNIYLDRFETRKIIFSGNALEIPSLKEGMLAAVNFELLWLKNKKNYYGAIFTEDDKRIKMLSGRWDIK
jgi:hypothetical protein